MRSLRANGPGDPIDGVRHPVINTRLTGLRAGIPRRHDADQEPPAGLLQHQRTTGVTLTTVPAAVLVTGAHHLVVNRHPDTLGAVPAFAYPVVDDRYLDGLQRLGTKPRTWTEGTPTGRGADLAEETFAAGR